MLVLCVAFVATRVFGLHSHVSLSHEIHEIGSSEHAHVAGQAPYRERITAPTAEGAAGHLDAHISHGDVDVDQPTAPTGKVSVFKAPAALIALLSTLFFAIPYLTTPVLVPPRRPPKYRSRPYLIPPSQAPPPRSLNG